MTIREEIANWSELEQGIFHILEEDTDEHYQIRKGIALWEITKQITKLLKDKGITIGEPGKRPEYYGSAPSGVKRIRPARLETKGDEG